MTATTRRAFEAVAAVGLVAAVPAAASAHFVLEEPACYSDQGPLGDPQKAPPCGDDGSLVESGDITAYQTGSTITITIHETIPHPGHYRVALAPTPGELPADPPVTAGTTACGSTTIMDPPVFPVLADGMLVHTAAFSGPQSFEVQLPPGMTCDHCTLQVIEFMSNHGLNNPGGCFYHHCATVTIADTLPDASMSTEDAGSMMSMPDASTAMSDAGSAGADAGVGFDGGSTTPPPASGGCSATGAGAGSAPAGLLAAFGLTALALRRRRRA
ncbi:MAG: SCE4755 family polysaccharide monooxygenase-like protein [Sandaracinus sp.]